MSNARPCRECGMKIEFRVGPNGRTMPLQRVRSVYSLDYAGEVVDVTRLWEQSITAASGAYFVNHWETCPNAAEIKREQRAQKET